MINLIIALKGYDEVACNLQLLLRLSTVPMKALLTHGDKPSGKPCAASDLLPAEP
jgi:hypothetical protein